MAEKSVFETLSSINVNGHTEERDGLTYLSWAWAWQEVKKVYPEATYHIERDPQTGLPYFKDAKLGIIVMTYVTIEGLRHCMWLPVMDSKNKAMREEAWKYRTRSGEKTVAPVTMFEVNKALMRCLVKNLAMFGLGIYIYAGEDIPEPEQEQRQAEAKEREAEEKAKELGERIKKGKSALIGISPWTEDTLAPIIGGMSAEEQLEWLTDAYREARVQLDEMQERSRA